MNAPVLGFVTAAAQFGLQSILVRPRRSIGPFQAQVTLKETHRDDLEITDHPVEQGAIITDHAYKRPAEVVIECGWSNSPPSSLVGGLLATAGLAASTLSGNSVTQVREVYEKLLKLQSDRIPFEVFTGKRVYRDMLIRSLVVVTDEKSENNLRVTATLRQVITVSTRTLSISAPREAQANPQATDPPVNSGTRQLQPAPNFNEQGNP